MSMTVISTTVAMCMAVRWRRSPMISAEDWPGLTCRLGFGQHDRIEDEYLSRLRAGAAYRRCRTVHVGRRMIVLQTSIYRPDGKLAAMMIQTDGAPEGVGHTCG